MANFEENLISNVQVHRCLYDKKAKEYHNRNIKEKAWDEISLAVGRSVADCQKRWRTLRERYSRELRRLNCPSGSGAQQFELWAYFESLSFLKDHVEPRETKNNCTKENENESESDFSSCSLPLKKKKKTFEDLCEKVEKKLEEISTNNSTDEVFMNTIISLMKDFPETKKDRARREIFRIVMDLKEDTRD